MSLKLVQEQIDRIILHAQPFNIAHPVYPDTLLYSNS